MKNPYETTSVKILKIVDEGSRSKLFTLEAPRGFKFGSGQFVIISLPGFGEAPFGICSDASLRNSPPHLPVGYLPAREGYSDFLSSQSRRVGVGHSGRWGGKFEICVRKVGMVTGALHAMKVGQRVGVRGPYGRPFPLELGEKRNLLLVAGGLGLEPLRPAIWEIVRNRKNYQKVQVFYGACEESDLLFIKDYDVWSKNVDFHLTLDKPKGAKIPAACNIGVVTALFDRVKLYENPVVFLCGPPVMYKFVIKKLKDLNFRDEDIYLSLERRMHCGVGVCNHCAVGSFFVCQDGPVFSWAELKDIRGAI